MKRHDLCSRSKQGKEHGDHDDKSQKGEKKKMSINEYATLIHIIGDLIQSIGVIIASLVIVIWPNANIADPISTLIFAVLVMCTTIKITKQCLKNLMEATPDGIDILNIEKELLDIDGV